MWNTCRVCTPSWEMALTLSRERATSLASALVLGPSLVFRSGYLLRRKSPWKPPGSHCSWLQMWLSGAEQGQPAAITYFLFAALAMVLAFGTSWREGLYLPVTVARSRLSSPLKVLLTSDCFPHRQREAC